MLHRRISADMVEASVGRESVKKPNNTRKMNYSGSFRVWFHSADAVEDADSDGWMNLNNDAAAAETSSH